MKTGDREFKNVIKKVHNVYTALEQKLRGSAVSAGVISGSRGCLPMKKRTGEKGDMEESKKEKEKVKRKKKLSDTNYFPTCLVCSLQR